MVISRFIIFKFILIFLIAIIFSLSFTSKFEALYLMLILKKLNDSMNKEKKINDMLSKCDKFDYAHQVLDEMLKQYLIFNSF